MATTTSKISKALARKEIARRALPKTDEARNEFPARHIMEATNGDLHKIAGLVAVAPQARKARETTKKAATPRVVARNESGTPLSVIAWGMRNEGLGTYRECLATLTNA